MPKDIAAPHNSAGGCNRYRQFDLQLDGLADFQLDWQNCSHAGLADVQALTGKESTP